MDIAETKLQKEIPVTVERWDGYYVASFSVGSPSRMSGVTDGKTLDQLVTNVQEMIDLGLEGENLADFGLAEFPTIALSYRMELDHPPAYTLCEWTGMFYTD